MTKFSKVLNLSKLITSFNFYLRDVPTIVQCQVQFQKKKKNYLLDIYRYI